MAASHRVAAWIGLAFGLLAGTAAAVEPFFAPPVPVGSIEVDLHAIGGVVVNTPTVASFGMPFPRESITTAGLSTLRVLDNGSEIPAYVLQLTPWRHRTNAAIDGQSVRVALVQVEVSFANLAQSKRITVEWGGIARTLNRPTRALRATTWHAVTSGSFPASENVMEPNVLAALPSHWLSRGVLRPTQALPFESDHPPTRDNASTNAATASWPGYTEIDHALKNNFYSVINEDDPLVTPANYCVYTDAGGDGYETNLPLEFDVWLYDRAATMFTLYFRSGFVKPLREAIRHSDYYRRNLNATGGFWLKPQDNKYSFNESLAFTYWMTGDETFLPAITATANYHNGSPHAWNSGLNFWTERMAAFKLMAHEIDYEITGSTTRRNGINTIINDLMTHQNGSLPGIPAARIDGGWYHLGFQHEDWDSDAYGASTWMTALLTDALRRTYQTGEDVPTAQMIRRSGTFLRTALRYEDVDVDDDGDLGVVWGPRYVIEHDGSDFAAEDPIHDVEHALDVVGAIAWADYFGALLGQRDPTLVQTIEDLYGTYDLNVNYWIRPGAPAGSTHNMAFRVNPWRKWGWEHRTTDGLAWAIAGAEAEPPLFANDFE